MKESCDTCYVVFFIIIWINPTSSVYLCMSNASLVPWTSQWTSHLIPFSWNVPILAMSLLYWKGRYIILCCTIKFGPNASHLYPLLCCKPEPPLYPPQCAAVELSWCKWFRQWALLLQREKYENTFQSEFRPLQNVSKFNPDYERYAQPFHLNRKVVKFSLGGVIFSKKAIGK